MNSERENFDDLALGYIQGILSDEEKGVVQELIVSSSEFLQVLKNEITIQKQLQALKEPLPLRVRERVYVSITTKRAMTVYGHVLEVVLKATLPSMARPVFKLFQRSVFVHE